MSVEEVDQAFYKLTVLQRDSAWREIERLQRWKAEATEVLSAYHEIAEAVEAFRPPMLGSSHPDNVMAFVREAIAAAEQKETP